VGNGYLQDLDMYYAETDTPAVARTSNLNEELGQVSPIAAPWSSESYCGYLVRVQNTLIACLSLSLIAYLRNVCPDFTNFSEHTNCGCGLVELMNGLRWCYSACFHANRHHFEHLL